MACAFVPLLDFQYSLHSLSFTLASFLGGFAVLFEKQDPK